MYKTSKRIFSFSICFLLFFQLSFSQSDLVQYIQTSLVIDGIAEKEWIEIGSSGITNTIEGVISSPADLAGRYTLAWNANNLYILIQVTDDVLYSNNNSIVTQDDGIEIYLDGNNNKSATFEADDFHYVLRYNDVTLYETLHNAITGVVASQRSTDTSVVYELRIPWSVIGQNSLDNNSEIGIDIHINDNDNAGREAILAWNATTSAQLNPSLLGTVSLTGKPLYGKLDKPNFSQKRGFFDSPFVLTISTSENSTIKYTLDGSNPLSSNTALSATSPVNVQINPTETTNRGGLTPGVVVRAVTVKDNYESSEVVTHSYIYIEQVKTQTAPYGNWPPPYNNMGTFDAQDIDYEMDPDIVYAEAYKDSIDDALLQIPTISLVTDIKNLFDNTTGIYMNAINQGSEWERPVSVELVNPDGSEDFQIDAGIRIRGGYSRHTNNPKHSFRLFFDKQYGEPKLDFPLFGTEGTDSYRKIDLCTAQNYSWSKEGSIQNNFLKDVSCRDIQGKMGHPYTRSRYYHLYINGEYWGLFLTEERPDARSASDYMGGDVDDYDVMKPERNLENAAEDLKVVATDGTSDAARRLWNKAVAGFTTTESYFEVQGLNPDGTMNPSYERLLDIDNLIDYIQIALYMDGYDAPLCSWTNYPIRPNNFFAIYNRVNPDGFKWYVHDFEHVMNTKNNEYNVGINNQWLITKTLSDLSTNFEFFNPYFIHLKLMQNSEYKMRFADRAFKNLTTGGMLTPDSLLAVINNRKEQFDIAIIAESARWGDAQVTVPKTKLTWLAAIDRIVSEYIPYRTDIVLQQFTNRLGYPVTDAPLIKLDTEELYGESKVCNLNDIISIINLNNAGDIYYTTDGSDPRANGGAIGTSAKSGSDTIEIPIYTSIKLKARVFNNNEWSPLKEIFLIINNPLSNLKITEIQYSPLDQTNIQGSELEFIELKNTGSQSINLTGFSFIEGIEYQFPTKTLASGAFVVLSSNSVAFNMVYGFMPDGEYIGNLNNGGEKITLVNATNDTIISFEYKDGSSWPAAADGLGNSLVPTIPNPTGIPDDYNYWRASANIGGSPGEDDPEPTITPIIFNEILANNVYPECDKIELYNPSSGNVDISYWFISDDKDVLKKWQIPAGTILPAHSYVQFKEGHYTGIILSSTSSEFGSAFSISSHGETLYLVSATKDSTLTGYGTTISFGEGETNISFGNYKTSTNETHFVAQSSNTFGAVNASPKVGPVILNEIMYHPNTGNFEFIELKNISASSVNLFADDNPANTWKLSGTGFSFPLNTSIGGGKSIFIIQQGITVSEFRLKYSIDNNSQVFNMTSLLSNDGELLELKKPGKEYIKNNFITYENILVEAVKYNDKLPWPQLADGSGYSLIRIQETGYANDPVNWAAKNVAPHVLIADNTNTTPGQDIQITFTEDLLWRNSISAVKINGQTINSSNYTISAGTILLKSILFASAGSYLVEVDAPKYNPSSVTQIINDNLSGPQLTADNSDNSLGFDIQITFTDNLQWRNSISEIKINGQTISVSDYTISSGQIQFKSTLFSTAGSFLIEVEASQYNPSGVTQIINDKLSGPVLTADISENYINESVVITFADNEQWRENISSVSLNNVILETSDYTISEGQIVLNSNLFSNPGTYTISIISPYYADNQISQIIKPFNTAPVVSSDNTDNYPNTEITLSFNANNLWTSNIEEIFINGTVSPTLYTISETSIVLDASLFQSKNEYPITIKAKYFTDVNLIQTIKCLMLVEAGVDQTICSSETVSLTGTQSETSGVKWTSKTNGIFGNSTSLQTSYTPGNTDINAGSTELILQTIESEFCSSVSDTVKITFNPVTKINSQVTVQTNTCENDPATELSVSATGTGTISYQWYNDSGAISDANTSSYTVLSTPSNTGNYYAVVHSECGSDVTGNISIITINPVLTNTIDAYICEGDNYQFGNLKLQTGGSYTQTFSSVHGCDSVVTLNLEVHEVPSVTLNSVNATCGLLNGTVTSTTTGGTGSYTYLWSNSETTSEIENLSGGMYYVTVNDEFCSASAQATVNETGAPVISVSSINDTYCKGSSTSITAEGADTYMWSPATGLDATEGATVNCSATSSTTYVVKGTKDGCSSFADISIHVNPVFTESINASIPYGGTFLFGTELLTESGEYVKHFLSKYQCDSTVNLSLQVMDPDPVFNEISDSGCGFYIFGGKIYTESGIYTDSLKTSIGFDSIVILNLTIYPTFYESIEQTIKYGESYILGNQTFSESGVYIKNFKTIHGCDSTVELSLTVLEPVSKTTILTDSACGYYNFAGINYYKSGVFTDSLKTYQGKDSIVILNLTIYPKYLISKNITIPYGSSYLFCGRTLTTSGYYTEEYQTIHGCDSIIELTLKVSNPVSKTTELFESECKEFTFAGNILTKSGTYTNNLKTYQGADSIVTLHLTIYPEYNETKTASAPIGESYIFGSQILTEPGIYTEHFNSAHGCDSIVTLTFSNLSTSLSPVLSNEIKVYPTIAHDVVTIEFEGEAEITVVDILGRPVLQAKSSKKHTFSLNTLQEGVYIVIVKQEIQKFSIFEINR